MNMRCRPWISGFAMFLGGPVIALAQGPELTNEAIEAVYKKRDKAAIEKLLAITIEGTGYHSRNKTAERILSTLGDKDGDVYEPTRKTLLGKFDDDWLQI